MEKHSDPHFQDWEAIAEDGNCVNIKIKDF